jgi:ferric-dicitrate binding protein FerR (iron transport regulator)
MHLALQRGELVAVDLVPPLRNVDEFDVWAQAGTYAVQVWQGSVKMNGYPGRCGRKAPSTLLAAGQRCNRIVVRSALSAGTHLLVQTTSVCSFARWPAGRTRLRCGVPR